MFSGLITRLKSETGILKTVLAVHDHFRDTAHAEQGAASIYTSGVRLPVKTDWRVYDHCAALTRLYGLYEVFVADLVEEYIEMLPTLYPRYGDLPKAIRNQHRLGVAQILSKLGKDGPYRELEEPEVIRGLSRGLEGDKSYSLLKEAFLIDPQNYRKDILVRILGYLGIENAWNWIDNHPAVRAFMLARRNETDTPETELRDFVKWRNEAGHGTVANVIATKDLIIIAEFVDALCEALSELIMREVVDRRRELGDADLLGTVIHRYSNDIVGASMKVCTIKVGNQLVVRDQRCCHFGRIQSIKAGGVLREELSVTVGQEIGLGLDSEAKNKAELIRLPETTLPSTNASAAESASGGVPTPAESAKDLGDEDLDAEEDGNPDAGN
jgi:hypothetical protein